MRLLHGLDWRQIPLKSICIFKGWRHHQSQSNIKYFHCVNLFLGHVYFPAYTCVPSLFYTSIFISPILFHALISLAVCKRMHQQDITDLWSGLSTRCTVPSIADRLLQWDAHTLGSEKVSVRVPERRAEKTRRYSQLPFIMTLILPLCYGHYFFSL